MAVDVRRVGQGFSETFALPLYPAQEYEDRARTGRLALAEYRKAWNLDLVKTQLDAKQKEYTDFEGALKQTEVESASGEKLKAFEGELAQNPEVCYSRAPSDDAY